MVLKKIHKKIHPKKAPREYLIVETGDEFSSYKKETNFERYFLNKIDEDSYYYLIPYLKEIFNEIPYTTTYVDEIIQNSKNPEWFKSSFLTKLFNLSILTKPGQEANQEIKNYLDEIDKTSIQELKQLNGNIFLLKNLSSLFSEKHNTDINNILKEHFKSIQILFAPTYLFTKSVFDAIDEIFTFTAFKKADKEYIPGRFL